jgi:type I restriction-modification system DNA methylase subunit
MKIVENVLNSVNRGTTCAFILPDKKLEKTSKGQMSRILRHHRLLKVVKLPENLFFGVGVTTSIFIFEAGKPQEGKKFFAVNIVEDGLVTVKNKGRHDVHGRWPAIEDYWVDGIERNVDSKYGTGQWIDPADHLSWQTPAKPFAPTEEDLMRAAMDYTMFTRGLDARELREKISTVTLYGSTMVQDQNITRIEISK